MLMVSTPPLLSYYSDLVPHHKPRQVLVWSILVINFTVLNVFRFPARVTTIP